ncbi:hypothetical protein Agabi119p4_7992 [Agaricus bisporus var. burnettii]|uniref:CFA20 domain-containing protein n=1 Tax=Agaricus bisporus var. burnettii TaxID=192524 RepID=A0A8H7EY37_AGABI|nr:hypothetical protein Agabi119p4_7992 [Agaricus bisporus var. burnettii]
MFDNLLQPSSISLFSSTSSEPLQLWAVETDASNQSCVRLLHDSASQSLHSESASLISPPPLVELGGAERGSEIDSQNLGYNLNQTVLHIQSPKLPTTYIQCPPNWNHSSLGLKHSWMHLQVRNVGRDWSFEVGLVDHSGRIGVLRMSTFQKQPRLKLSRGAENSLPLLHLPLSFPSRSFRPLTAWTTINLHLPTFIPYFSQSNLLTKDEEDQDQEQKDESRLGPEYQSWEHGQSLRQTSNIPSGSYSHISYIRVYATCRLRRIWFDENGRPPWEFELYSAD